MRGLLLVLDGLAIAFFAYVVMTVPMIAMTGPAVILVALVAAFVFIYRSGRPAPAPDWDTVDGSQWVPPRPTGAAGEVAAATREP